MTCQSITPFVESRATRSALNPTGVGQDNCQNGGLITFSVVVDILGTANGTNRTVAVSEGGAAGDFLRLQPFEDKMRIHNIFFSGVAADVAQVGFRGVFKNGKEVQPTMTGSLDGGVICAASANFPLSDGIGGQVNPLNPECLPAFDNDAPLEIALASLDAGPHLEICLTVVLEYVAD